ncbi:glycosyltransferase family 4 protein [soil metagenome]
MTETSGSPLRILHAVRSPVGGIIRHILDVANGQIDRGHHVGIISGNLTGGERADAMLAKIAPRLELGLHRLAIQREPHPADISSAIQHLRLINRLKPQVLHGHGAKSGVFFRLKSAAPNMIRVYTPHGGSLHYPPNSLKGAFYARLERAFMNRTDLFLFESDFARKTYERVVGKPAGLVRCVFNGVTAAEFDPITLADDATDLLYVGQFWRIKGPDLLLDAVARLHADGRPVTLTMAGDGEETDALKAQINRLNLESSVRFLGFVPPRFAFTKGKVLVVPSRGDSMPYVVIEAAAAGLPIVAASIGGIPEILGQHTEGLFAASSIGAMADAIETALGDLDASRDRARSLRERVFAHFSQNAMVEGILAAYRDALNLR